MSEVVVVRSEAAERSARIRANYAAAEESQRRSVDLYRQIGLDLLEQKKECGHGNWLPWLKANVPFSHSHATRYMKLANVASTQHLDEAWRVILGNADEPEEAEAEAESQAPAVEVPRPGAEIDPAELDEAIRVARDNWAAALARSSAGDDVPSPEQLSRSDESVAPLPGSAAEWSPSELERRAVLEAGGTVVLNMKADGALYAWALQCGRFERVDRRSDWGNPFVLDEDGDRDEVCDAYAVYLGYKRGLLKRVNELRGKALGCWCHPLRCHGDHLADLAQGGEG